MKMDIKKKEAAALYGRIRQILESAKTTVARSVNTTQVVANWLVGREIVEEQQKGAHKAGYGDALLANLAAQLVVDFGPGYSGTNLRWFRQFYFVYGDLLSEQICHAVRDKLMPAIVHAVRGESESAWKQPVD